MVFLPMLGADDIEAAEERAAEYADDRLTYFWDSNRTTALTWQAFFELDGPAWDMYFLFDTDSKWGDGVTAPAWVMAGHGAIGDKIDEMDIDVFEAELKQLLAKEQ